MTNEEYERELREARVTEIRTRIADLRGIRLHATHLYSRTPDAKEEVVRLYEITALNLCGEVERFLREVERDDDS